MPIFRHVGGSILTERNDTVPIGVVRALSEHWAAEAWLHHVLHEPTLEAIYMSLRDDAQAAVDQADAWHLAAIGAVPQSYEAFR